MPCHVLSYEGEASEAPESCTSGGIRAADGQVRAIAVKGVLRVEYYEIYILLLINYYKYQL